MRNVLGSVLRLTEARKADSKSTQRKDSGLSQGNLKGSHSPAASSLPHHEKPLKPKVGTSLSGGAVSNRSVPLHSSFLEKSAGIIKNANGPPLLRAQGGDSEGKVNTGLKENIDSKEQQTEQGQDGRSLGEERAEDQHDDVTSEFKILHSLNSVITISFIQLTECSSQFNQHSLKSFPLR